jgi:hypothetical protein
MAYPLPLSAEFHHHPLSGANAKEFPVKATHVHIRKMIR